MKDKNGQELSIGQQVLVGKQAGIVLDLSNDLAQVALQYAAPPRKDGQTLPHFVTEACGLTQSRVWVYTRIAEVKSDEILGEPQEPA
jgi:hypothetical protein